MEKEFLERMLNLAREGGEIALDLMEKSAPTLKPDQSVLTKADTAVADLIRENLKDMLATKDHILIDEEDAGNAKYFDQKKLESVPYVWSIDPIDGTRNFANRTQLFGISIGLLKDLKPWLGVVYLPALGELFFCDGQQSFFVKNAFTQKEERGAIIPVEQHITQQSFYIGSDALFEGYEWDFSFCQILMPSCAVIDLCWPAIGRGCGCFFGSHIWDFAGAWPIFRSAGLDLRAISTGKVLDRISADLFMGQGSKTWRLREHHILSTEKNYPLINKNIKQKA